MLTNETYIGNMTQGRRKKLNYKSKKEIRTPKEQWIIKENTHEAIIDKKVFDTVGELLKKNKNKPTGNNIMLLSGFMKCRECNHKIGINKSSDGKRYYTHCSYYTAHSKYGLCTPHSLNYKKLENLVLEEIRKLCKEYVDSTTFKERIEEARKKNDSKVKKQDEISILEKKIKINNSYIDKVYEDKLNGNIDIEMFNRLTARYKDEIISFKKRLESIEKENINSDKVDTDKDILEKINEYLSLEKPSRALLVNLIDKILISEDKTIKIHYKFKLY